ncbi:MAG: T9SS type A sorting domain-containing protein [Cytophagales bacterium]|nr:T9SS type A sorting domain-containing protein [Cytophagales bacterium]
MDTSIVTDEICGNGQGAVDITVSGGTTPYTFTWSNGATTEDISGLSAGNYTCQITDINGCILNLSATVTNAVGSLIMDTSIVTDEICGNGQGAVDITVSGGTTPYIFTWSNGDTTEDISGLSAGNYTCQITDFNGCIINLSATVTNAAGSLILNSSIVTDEICGNGQGAVDISVSGGTTPYTYLWSNGATTEDISGLSAGNYTCTITDINGCVINISENVLNQTGTFSLDTIIVTYEICGNGQGVIDITVSGGISPYTYAWSNGATSEDINGLSAGNYSVVITDNSGCIINQTVDVLNATGTFSLDNIIVTGEYCGNGLGAIDVTMSGGVTPYSFTWSNGAVTEDITGLSAGNYTCVITDSTGCIINTAGDVLNQTFGYSVDSIIAIDEVCNNGQGAIDITVSGGFPPYTFAWSNGGTTEDIINLTAGNYTCIITDSLGCILNTGGTVLNETQGFNLAAAIVTDEICGNGQGTVDITVSGGVLPYSFAWSNAATTEDINGLSAGNFTVTITDSLGCIAGTTVTVLNDPGNLIISNVTITDEICGNGSGAIDITVSGGYAPYTFIWSNGAVTEDITGLSADTFTVTVTDSNGCVSGTTITVLNSPGTLTISNVGITDEVCGNGAGAVDITISGGSAPYTFVWSNGTVTEDITGLSADTFTVTITDSNGCITDTSVTVLNSPGTLSMTITGITDDNCGYGIGAIDITVTGGNAPYNFIWSNGATTEDISGLDTGIYTVIVTDNNGCLVTESATINDSTGGPPLTSNIIGFTTVSEFAIENYSVALNAGSEYYWAVTGGNQISGGLTNAIGVYWGAAGTGLLSVVEKSSNGCFGDTIYLTVNIGGTGINIEDTSLISVKVYPNPNTGTFTLELQIIEEQNVQLKIINILGIEVFSEELIMGSRNLPGRVEIYHKVIDFKKYASGIYQLRIVTDQGVITRHITINK